MVGAAIRPIDILSMPPELVLNILNNMSRFEQINFMLATWHFLVQNRVVPRLTDPAPTGRVESCRISCTEHTLPRK